ncbi:aromatic acid exporter family protein [Streptomyces bacillaris]|uniref:Aromatic acid exporter family protein n=1 Tax=Streptomyces cavourensis TaxID=67258 RepID=A0AAD0VH08_9ACTN|nr:FUSC family protein [Streptomyces cavourensis]AXI74452.1 aromatic acid exporter family protein [Streptomyces cavourensis]
MYEACSRVKDNLWPVLQQSAAAALSWWIAGSVFDHHVPLFAPIATLVALNTPVGGRGTNAVRVMSGVIAGVVVGQVAFRFLGHGDAAVGVAVLGALLVALLLDGERITMAQAAVGAVISVAAGQQAGIDRVLDALLGAGVALVFSQVLFPPHPFALLRRTEAATLKGLGRALELAARTLDAAADEREEQPWKELRPVYTLLNDLGRTRDDAIAVARRTPRWRGRREPIRQEIAATRHLDLLGNSCLTLIRGATVLDPGPRKASAATVRGLSGVLDALAEARGSHAVFQHAARRTLAVVRDAPEHGSAVPVAVRESVRLVATDILVFAGADADEAERAVRDGSTDITVERRARPGE